MGALPIRSTTRLCSSVVEQSAHIRSVRSANLCAATIQSHNSTGRVSPLQGEGWEFESLCDYHHLDHYLNGLEHSAHNRLVLGSNPRWSTICLCSQAAKTVGCNPMIGGSNPLEGSIQTASSAGQSTRPITERSRVQISGGLPFASISPIGQRRWLRTRRLGVRISLGAPHARVMKLVNIVDLKSTVRQTCRCESDHEYHTSSQLNRIRATVF